MNQEEKEQLSIFIERALLEDVGDGDHTSLATVPKGKQGIAELLIKDEGILSGMEEAEAIFLQVDPTLNLEIRISDGTAVRYGDVPLIVKGNIHSILIAERLVLNVMQRMSGIATTTHKITVLLEGTKTKVLDTRKTTPLLRFLEKKAVRAGGGTNHRTGLYDMILIKDNHVDYAGGIREAIEAANNYRQRLNKSIQIEVEVRNLDELQEAMEVGQIDRIMLDNFTPELTREAVRRIDGRFITESSGGITADTVRQYAEAGVDFISIGGLTHSVKSMDISLKARILD